MNAKNSATRAYDFGTPFSKTGVFGQALDTPQGSVISPFLSNIYLHYVQDLWAHQWRQRHATGQVTIVRYADDSVVGFEQKYDAVRYLAAVRERMAKFGLVLHPDKTGLIEFGRYAERNRKARGEGRPEAFDFLGFTHCCGKTRKGRYEKIFIATPMHSLKLCRV